MKKLFSVILPIYGHADHLKQLVNLYETALNSLGKSYELIFVVNGNDLASFEIIKELARKNSYIRVLFLKEKGWGNAVIEGIKNAQGELICYTNAARTRPEDLIFVLKLAEKNPNSITKTKRNMHVNTIRKIGSFIYNMECRLLLKIFTRDVNGTPKVITNSLLKQLHLASKDDLIDAEILAKAIRLHVPIIEIPILFPKRHSGKSTTNFLSAYKMYAGVFGLRKLLKKQ